ncbi:aminopeptidase N-like [Anticarsia gemmatalis]|uniref:aminopeptidase N-like n=1 Tax=Anticarsia gemmatalis TaxID=129554 RepID=UPI003F76F59B
MPTYLVGLLVSKLASKQTPRKAKTVWIKVFARRDLIDQTIYAATFGFKALNYYVEWYNESFPLPEMGLIAVPNFPRVSMENWGIAAVEESKLLYDGRLSSFLDKQALAERVAHELAHQWFGNLVSVKWWSDLWLNEAFSSFASSAAVSKVEPTWRYEKLFGAERMLWVLDKDALETSHPVAKSIEDPKHVTEFLDEMTLKKGSIIMRMLDMALGDVVLRKGVKSYFQKYAYGNAEADDLWQELTTESEQFGGLTRNASVKEIMDSWTTQTGYPLLTVTRDYGAKSLTITQKRFLSQPNARMGSATWWVPLSMLCTDGCAGEGGRRAWAKLARGPRWRRAGGRGESAMCDVIWLEPTEDPAGHRFEHGASAEDWVLVNYDMIAPIRVNYDQRNWQLLAEALKVGDYRSIPELGRVQLLSDAFTLAWTNHLDYATTLSIANYLHRERSFLPLYTGLQGLQVLDDLLRRTSDYGVFEFYVASLIRDAYEKAGGIAEKKIVNYDDLNSVRMQITTSDWACRMKVPGCEENAIQMFQQWMDSPNPDYNNPIPLDLRSTVYCVAVSRGSLHHWQFVLQRYQRVAGEPRALLLRALACANDVGTLLQYLEWAVSDETKVRREDTGVALASVLASNVGYYVAQEFVYDRVEDIHNALDNQTEHANVLEALLLQFTTQKELDHFESWYGKHGKYFDHVKSQVEKSVQKAKENIKWVSKHRQTVVERLREHENMVSLERSLRRAINAASTLITEARSYSWLCMSILSSVIVI